MSYAITYEDLHLFTANVFEACGVSTEKSSIAANVICYADENGIDSHGVFNLSRIYVPQLLSGNINPRATPEVIADNVATALLDGHGGLGLLIADYAMDLALEKAKKFGIGMVNVRRSTHFGSAGYYAAKALKEKMIGIASTNLGWQAIVRPPLGVECMLGTNPISFAAPTHTMPPFLLDMSTTVVSTGKLRVAMMKGESIPQGWLVDDDGDSLTDPGAYDQGIGHLRLLGGDIQTGGYKGFGLAILVDILCGILSDAYVGTDSSLEEKETSLTANNIGHCFLAIKIDNFVDYDKFIKRTDRMLNSLTLCPTTENKQKVIYPGWSESKNSESSRQSGIPLDEHVYHALCELSTKLNIAPPNIIKK